MKRASALLMAIGLVAAFFNIGSGAGSKPKRISDMPAKSINVTIADSSSIIKMNVGDTLHVTLVGIAGTGYNWYLDEIDTMFVGKLDLPEPAPPEKPSRVGAPNEDYFHFKALAPGKTILRLAYKRIWEKDVPPAKTFELKLDIAALKEKAK